MGWQCSAMHTHTQGWSTLMAAAAALASAAAAVVQRRAGPPGPPSPATISSCCRLLSPATWTAVCAGSVQGVMAACAAAAACAAGALGGTPFPQPCASAPAPASRAAFIRWNQAAGVHERAPGAQIWRQYEDTRDQAGHNQSINTHRVDPLNLRSLAPDQTCHRVQAAVVRRFSICSPPCR